jgi:hypothetical protein
MCCGRTAPVRRVATRRRPLSLPRELTVPTRRRHSPIRLAAAKVPVDRERSDLKDLIRRDYSPTSRPPQARTGALAQLPGEPQLHVIIARKQAVRSRLV